MSKIKNYFQEEYGDEWDVKMAEAAEAEKNEKK